MFFIQTNGHLMSTYHIHGPILMLKIQDGNTQILYSSSLFKETSTMMNIKILKIVFPEVGEHGQILLTFHIFQIFYDEHILPVTP